jgi:large subunit ribosomal protein L18
VQCIDDIKNKVIFGLSTLNLEFKKQHKYGGNKKAAEDLGKMFVEITKKKKIKECVFDRSGYLYQGRIKAFVESARDAGLKI